MAVVKCEKHGVFYGRKADAKYCPECGKHTVRIPTWPIRVYVHEHDVIAVIITVVASLLLWLIVTGVKSCSAEEAATAQKRQQLINSMPTEWNYVYRVTQSLYSDDMLKYYQGLEAKTDFNPGSLTPEQSELLLERFSSNERAVVAKFLQKFITPTTRPS